MNEALMAQVLLAFLIVIPIVIVITYYLTKSSVESDAKTYYENLLDARLAAARAETKDRTRKDAAVDFAGMVPSALVIGEQHLSEERRIKQIEVLMHEHRELLDSKVRAAREAALNEGREEVRRSIWYERRYYQTTEKDGIFKKSYYIVLEERLMMGQLAISGWVIHKTKLHDKLDQEALDKVAAVAKGICAAVGAAMGHPAGLAGAALQLKATPKHQAIGAGSETIPLTGNAITQTST